MKKVVVIGGGTGTYTVLKGLRQYEELQLSAVVTMADDGGSNKVLRDEFGMLPTSGLRQCMVALSSNEGLLRELFAYRYYHGVGISGMTFGNLFMAAATDVLGDERKAIKETAKLLGVRGKILPVSYDTVSLLATYEDGTEVLGEHLIDLAGKRVGDMRITNLRTIPETVIDHEAKEAIEQADLIVIGPGDLYTNTIANLVVRGVSEAIAASCGKVVFVVNLMTKRGESAGYSASDYLKDLGKYMPLSRLNWVIVNEDKDVESSILRKYAKEGAGLVKDDLGNNTPYQVVKTSLLAKGKVEKEKGDSVVRSMARHDAQKLAKVIFDLM
ncbi:MAG: gluconeogenesis factor YvcK family protein [bacterium]